jgi:hypothetical protein
MSAEAKGNFKTMHVKITQMSYLLPGQLYSHFKIHSHNYHISKFAAQCYSSKFRYCVNVSVVSFPRLVSYSLKCSM